MSTYGWINLTMCRPQKWRSLSPHARFRLRCAGVRFRNSQRWRNSAGSDQGYVMILGPSGSGSRPLHRDWRSVVWRYLSDVRIVASGLRKQFECRSFSAFLPLQPETLAAVDLPQGVFNEPSGTAKERITPQEHFDSDPIEQATPGYIIFTNVTREPQSRLASLTSAEAMTGLLRLCPWATYDKPTS